MVGELRKRGGRGIESEFNVLGGSSETTTSRNNGPKEKCKREPIKLGSVPPVSMQKRRWGGEGEVAKEEGKAVARCWSGSGLLVKQDTEGLTW